MAHTKSIGQIPVLIGVEHDRALLAHQLPQHGRPPQISAFFRRPDLKLECGEALIESRFGQLRHFVVAVVHPADRGVIPGIATLENALPSRAGIYFVTKHRNGTFLVNKIFHIGEVKNANELFWAEIEKELPKRNATALRPEVETGIRDRREGEMNDPFVRSEPAKRCVVRDASRDAPEVGHYRLDRFAFQGFSKHGDGLANQVVPIAKREDKAGPGRATVGSE